ncbi:unnamed protein product [Fraxinus pennsylvanica]|uniref:Uncharacterized protein n=1 Tax=Fraxinus pennsylvanica TaxID=56036 RepID=A0AAD1ZHP8_9LAMI|nr:unnamed protein product [Fraxinus pennsylvanica]
MFTSYLEKNGEKVGICVGVDKSEEGYARKLVEKLGFSMGREVKSLILEACVALEEWENQALLAIEKVSDRGLVGKQKCLTRKASFLLMMAHDEFTVSELCLHYLLASRNLDEVIFSACVSKLNGEEMMALIKYLRK